MKKHFVFRQNNSGSRYTTSAIHGHYVIIAARDESQAKRKADKIGLYDLSYCDCCGPRFDRQPVSEFDTEAEAREYIRRQGSTDHYGNTVIVISHV